MKTALFDGETNQSKLLAPKIVSKKLWCGWVGLYCFCTSLIDKTKNTLKDAFKANWKITKKQYFEN